MERRAYTRHPLNLSALFTINHGEYQRCIVRDFCMGGMFLAYSQATPDETAKQNDLIHIHFTLALAEQKKDCFLQAKVARAFRHGLGISFIEPDQQILHYLSQLAKPQQPTPLGQPQSNQKTKQYIQIIHNHLSSMLLCFFQEVSIALFDSANTANSNSEQNEYMDAVSEVKKLQHPIEKLFIEQILQQLQKPAQSEQTKKASSLDELSLIGQDEFDDWLNVANLISKAESHYESLLIDLQPRLSQIFQVKYSKDNLPIGPATICNTFQQALQDLETENITKKVIYQVFEKTVINQLEEVYTSLQALLDQHGIAKTKHKLTAQKTASKLEPEPTSKTQKDVKPIAVPSMGASQHPIHQTLHHLTQLTQANDSMTPELATRIQQIAPNQAINADQQQVVTSVDQLLSAVGDDQCLTRPVQLWFKDLHLPMLQLALNQPQLLSQDHNPVQQTLDQISELGQLITADDRIINKSIKQQIDSIIAQIEQSEGNLDGFNDASSQLQPLLERQRKNHMRNLDRVAKTCDGKYKLIRSRKVVEQALVQQFSDHRIPTVILDFLDSGWRDFLVLTHVKHGSHAKLWQQQIKLLQKLFLAFQHIPLAPRQIEILLHALQQSLNQPGIDKHKLHELFDFCHDVLSGKTSFSARRYQKSIHTTPRLPSESEDIPHWIRQALKLAVGDWIDITQNSVTRQAKLAWHSEDKEQFVFVNRQGLQVAEFALDELAEQLAAHDNLQAKNMNMGAMDRATYGAFQKMYEQLAYQSTHDELTGLLNRKAFEEQITQTLHHGEQNHHLMAYFDLDQFKVINNTCSHQVGDLLLQQIAKLLQQKLPKTAILARLGGDEFGIFLSNCEFSAGCQIIEQQHKNIENFRFQYDGKTFTHTVSIGVVEILPDSVDIAQLLRAADESCYAAKDAGRNRILIYQYNNAELNHRHNIMQWVSEITHALEQGRLGLRCQRITPISNQDLIPHYEVLLSVIDKDGKWLPPADFIQAAESYQRMTAVDQWVVKTTLNWLNQNLGALDHLGGLAINLSGQSLNDHDFLQFILQQFKQLNVPPEKICFEVTETVAIGDFNDALTFMQDIQDIGCELALDDFGTGLSSYAYLKNMPVDYLKIDGVFIKDILTNKNDQAMVKSINEIAHVMGKKTIAEYVEDQAIFNYLKQLGIDFAQGYGVEKPRILFEMK